MSGYFLGDDFGYVGRFAALAFADWPRLFVREVSEGLWGGVTAELRPIAALAFILTSPTARSLSSGRDEDLSVARRICSRRRALRIGLVDTVVIATAERLNANAIATLDLRHFAAVSIKGNPRLLPRDR